MTVVQVFFKSGCRPAAHLNFELVELDCADFEQFLIAADGDGIVCGSRLITARAPDERHCRIVLRRTPIAFRGSAIERAQLPDYRLVEGDE